MTSASNLSDQTGIPKGRRLPFFLGMYVRRAGCHWYRSLRNASMMASIFSNDMESTVSSLTPVWLLRRSDKSFRKQSGTGAC